MVLNATHNPERNTLTIEFALSEWRPTSSAKTLSIGGTSGFQSIGVDIAGIPVRLSANIISPKAEDLSDQQIGALGLVRSTESDGKRQWQVLRRGHQNQQPQQASQGGQPVVAHQQNPAPGQQWPAGQGPAQTG